MFRGAASASLALIVAPAAALPPPVEVTPLVVAAEADGALAHELATLIAELGRVGHFAAASADPALVPDNCAPGDPERERCFADAARGSGVPHLVFVIVEPSDDGVRIDCVGGDAARARQAVLFLAEARGDDAAARLRQRSRLSSCLIGALHAPARDRSAAR